MSIAMMTPINAPTDKT